SATRSVSMRSPSTRTSSACRSASGWPSRRTPTRSTTSSWRSCPRDASRRARTCSSPTAVAPAWRASRRAPCVPCARSAPGPTRRAPDERARDGAVTLSSVHARRVRALLARWPGHPTVDLVATDGFLHPRRVLEARGILQRKGFPESYDLRALIGFLSDVKSGRDEVAVPVYSHLTYDIVPDEFQRVRRPAVLIVEGLNILQPGEGTARAESQLFASDFFDFTIYVDAAVPDIRRWYVERFLALRKTAFQDPSSYFHRYAELTDDDAETVAASIWHDINEPNLIENILPTRQRAQLILEQAPDHSVQSVRLQKR